MFRGFDRSMSPVAPTHSFAPHVSPFPPPGYPPLAAHTQFAFVGTSDVPSSRIIRGFTGIHIDQAATALRLSHQPLFRCASIKVYKAVGYSQYCPQVWKTKKSFKFNKLRNIPTPVHNPRFQRSSAAKPRRNL